MRSPTSAAHNRTTSRDRSAAPDDRAATINSSCIVAAAATILIVGIARGAAIIDTATACNCAPANNGSSANDRSASRYCSSAISGTAPNGAATVAAASSDLHNQTVIGRSRLGEVFGKDRNWCAHCRRDKQGHADESRNVQLKQQIA